MIEDIEREQKMCQPEMYRGEEQILEELYSEEFRERVLELLKNDPQVRREIVSIAMKSPNMVTQY